MRYNPTIRHRRSIRLASHDYAQAGAYFVTICTHNRHLILVDRLTREIVSNAWRDLRRRFPSVRPDQFVVMPNHVHGIIWIRSASPMNHPVGAQLGALLDETPPKSAGPQRNHDSASHHAAPLHRAVESAFYNASPRSFALEPGSLGVVVRAFKSRSAKRINRLRRTPGAPVWQRNYYEHIIREEEDLTRIRQYIRDNPAKWAEDVNNPANWPNGNP